MSMSIDDCSIPFTLNISITQLNRTNCTSLYPFFPPVGARVGRQRLQGSEGEAYHAPSLAACHPRRRRVGQSDQGNDRRRWCHSAHPQIADWQKGRPRITTSPPPSSRLLNTKYTQSENARPPLQARRLIYKHKHTHFL